MAYPGVITFLTRLEDFAFLGIENVVKEDSDFGAFWGNFFDKGGFDKIDPYQADPNCVNVWYNRPDGEKIYFQGKIVHAGTPVPAGYTLGAFPGGAYLVVTTEWLESYDESMKHINTAYYENAAIPAGYERKSDDGEGIFLIERWGADTGEGYRYEYWLPVRRVQAE